MSWQDQIPNDLLPWLLEEENPGVRYLTMRDLLSLSPEDAGLVAARRAAHKEGPIAQILAEMQSEGYWVKPGAGYTTKYYGTQWSLLLLAQLGASVEEDARIAQACEYMLEHSLTSVGQFSVNGKPSYTIDCLQGNMCWTLLELGYADPRLEKAYEWMTRSVTGEGVAPAEDRQAPVRYYAYQCGPNFACGPNGKLPCAWGAVKVMLAFSKWPQAQRTPLIERAIQQGVDFLFSVDPASADYPTRTGGKPNQSWWKFGFPVFYITDILQLVEALVALGYGNDPRLANALALVRSKQDARGRWPLSYDYKGKTWVEFGVKREPNKWVTLRAMRVMKAVDAR